MITTIEFKDDSEIQAIVDANKDKTFIEQQHLFTGNFLVFSDVKPQPTNQELNDNQLTIMDVLATFYDGMTAKGTM